MIATVTTVTVVVTGIFTVTAILTRGIYSLIKIAVKQLAATDENTRSVKELVIRVQHLERLAEEATENG